MNSRSARPLKFNFHQKKIVRWTWENLSVNLGRFPKNLFFFLKLGTNLSQVLSILGPAHSLGLETHSTVELGKLLLGKVSLSK